MSFAEALKNGFNKSNSSLNNAYNDIYKSRNKNTFSTMRDWLKNNKATSIDYGELNDGDWRILYDGTTKPRNSDHFDTMEWWEDYKQRQRGGSGSSTGGSGSTSGGSTEDGTFNSDTKADSDGPGSGSGEPTTGGSGSDVEGFAFPGGTEYSATGLQTLLSNPYAFAQAWLQSMGNQWNTPSMLAALGQMPALAPSLELLLYGDQGSVLDGIDAPDSARRYVDIMRGQLTPGGGISAEELINKILSIAKTEVSSPGTGNEDEIRSRLGAIVGGITGQGGSSADQINTINDLIKVAMINAAPARAGVIANMLDYYANSYLTDVAKVNETTPVVSYASWLADKGLMF